jgi:hypothetical protein
MINSRDPSHSGQRSAGNGLPRRVEYARYALYFSRPTLFHCRFVYRVAK